MKKLQTGGVSQVIPRPLDVGDIPVFNAPTFDLTPIPIRDMAALASKMQYQKAQKEASDLAESKYQDSLESAYLDYNTKFFGNLHTTEQKQRIDGLQQKYNIPEQGNAAVLANQVLLKDTLRNFRLALTDQDYIQTVGEVDRGNKFREYAEKNFDKETFVDWEQNAWQPYVNGQVGLEGANPVKFKESKVKPKDFTLVDGRFEKELNYVDLSNPDEVNYLFSTMVQAYKDADEEAAIRQKIIDPETGGLTKEKQDQLIFGTKMRQRGIEDTRDAKNEDWLYRKQIADAFADGNRQGRSSSSGNEPEDIEKLYRRVEVLEGIEIPRDDEEITVLMEAYADGTEAEREAIVKEIKKRAAARPKKPAQPLAPQSLPQQTAPRKKTLDELMSENGI
jgi:hypothetical protein